MPEPVYSDSSCTGPVPTYLGGARGRRAFYLDEQGVLRGITYRAPWRDGENVAECMVTKVVNPMGTTGHHSFIGTGPPYYSGGVVFHGDPQAAPEPAPGMGWARCGGLDPECACGFYAYHSGETMYALSGPGCRVMAIVEAYGRMVLGTAGYRAQKARILAVCAPPPNEARRRSAQLNKDRRELLKQLSVAHASKFLPGRSVANLNIAAVVLGIFTATVPPPIRPAMVLLMSFLGVSLVVVRRALRQEKQTLIDSLEDRLAEIDKTLRGLPEDYTEHIERAKERYPGVEFFEDPAAMRKAYPVESLAALASEVAVTKEESDG